MDKETLQRACNELLDKETQSVYLRVKYKDGTETIVTKEQEHEQHTEEQEEEQEEVDEIEEDDEEEDEQRSMFG